MADVTVNTDIDTFLQSADKAAARTSLELGATDTVEFGGFVPPTGTTAEIDALFSSSLATPDAIYFDRDKKIQWQALTSSTRQEVSGRTVSDGYSVYVDSENGDDAIGAINDQRYPFLTIKSALNALDSENFGNQWTVYIGPGLYDEIDVFGDFVNSANRKITIVCAPSVFFASSLAGTVFENGSGYCKFGGILGYPEILGTNKAQLYLGDGLSDIDGGIARFEIGRITVSDASYVSLIKITDDRAKIVTLTVTLTAGSVASNFALIEAAGGSRVLVKVPYMLAQGDGTCILKLEGSSHGTLQDSTCQKTSLARLVDANSILVLKSCVQNVPAFPPVTAPSVLADVATSNVFAWGVSVASKVVDADITLDTTFGSLVIDADSIKVLR